MRLFGDGHDPYAGLDLKRWGRDDELYDLAADPGERIDVASIEPNVAADPHSAALAVVAQRPRTGERVEALGYLD